MIINYYNSDYFLESMVLLRWKFCWDWDDVLFFVTNARPNPKKLSETTKSNRERWNSFDSKIFEHFNRTFWNLVQNYPDFENDKAILQNRLGLRRFTENVSQRWILRWNNVQMLDGGKGLSSWRVKLSISAKPECATKNIRAFRAWQGVFLVSNDDQTWAQVLGSNFQGSVARMGPFLRLTTIAVFIARLVKRKFWSSGPVMNTR